MTRWCFLLIIIDDGVDDDCYANDKMKTTTTATMVMIMMMMIIAIIWVIDDRNSDINEKHDLWLCIFRLRFGLWINCIHCRFRFAVIESLPGAVKEKNMERRGVDPDFRFHNRWWGREAPSSSSSARAHAATPSIARTGARLPGHHGLNIQYHTIRVSYNAIVVQPLIRQWLRRCINVCVCGRWHDHVAKRGPRVLGQYWLNKGHNTIWVSCNAVVVRALIRPLYGHYINVWAYVTMPLITRTGPNPIACYSICLYLWCP